MTLSKTIVDQLCLRCGLCCDGTIFRDVQLQPGDDPVELKSLGLPLRMTRCRGGDDSAAKPPARFPQPCAALGADCRCHLYEHRPVHCRQFECALFQAVRAGASSIPTAQRLIGDARRRADRVRHLLRALDNADEQAPLGTRFRAVRKAMEAAKYPAANIDGRPIDRLDLFHQLSLQMHRLNLLLGARFYPDPNPLADFCEPPGKSPPK